MEIGNDALTNKIRRANEIEDFFVILTDKGELESIFSRVNVELSWTSRSVQTMDDLALDAYKV